MNLPFSREQFLEIFAAYNVSIWPMQIVLFVMAVMCFANVFLRRRGNQIAAWMLSMLWAWMAVAYHFVFFSRINAAAWIFGGAFLAGGGLFGAHALQDRLRFGSTSALDRTAALLLSVYALVGYPLVGLIAGHEYPRAPTFGLPCPTTIFTLAMLILAERPPVTVFLVPFAWTIVGSMAAFELGMVEDYGLLAAGFIAAGVLATRVHHLRLWQHLLHRQEPKA